MYGRLACLYKHSTLVSLIWSQSVLWSFVSGLNDICRVCFGRAASVSILIIVVFDHAVNSASGIFTLLRNVPPEPLTKGFSLLFFSFVFLKHSGKNRFSFVCFVQTTAPFKTHISGTSTDWTFSSASARHWFLRFPRWRSFHCSCGLRGETRKWNFDRLLNPRGEIWKSWRVASSEGHFTPTAFTAHNWV